MISRMRLVLAMVIMAIVSGLLGFGYAQNLDVMNLPMMTAPVMDYTNTFTQQQLDELNMVAVGLESGHQGVQVTAVIIPDRQGHELFDIGMKIAQDNAIGSKQYNNGLLLVIAKNEKKLRIFVGYGLEGLIPDILARQIIEQDLRPFVDQGDIVGAVQAWYRIIPQYLIQGSTPDQLQQTNRFESLGILVLFLAFGLVGWGGYIGSKLGDYLNGKENNQQLDQLKQKSGFVPYSWFFGIIMFMGAATVGFIAWAVSSWIVGFVVGVVGSYSRLISPNFWQLVKSTMYRERSWGGGFGGSNFGGGFSGGGRSGGGGSFGGGGAGD